jgi:hypothetical protein
MTQLDNITKRPLLPVITIQKTSGVYTYNPFTSTFDFRVGTLTVKPAFDAVGGNFTLQIIGGTGTNSEMNTLLSNISEGNEVTIWVGKTDASKTKIFLGIIENIEINEPNKNFMEVILSGPDWGSDILKNRIVNYQWDQNKISGVVDTTDTSTTIVNIVTDLLNTTKCYPSAAADSITAVSQGILIDSSKIVPINYSLPTFSARYEFLDDKLQELDDFGLSYHYVDPDKYFIMSQNSMSTTSAPATILFTDDVNDATSWTSGKVGLIAPNSSFKRTLESHKRRVFGLGGLSATVDQQSTTTSSNDTLASVNKAMRFTPTKTMCSSITVYLSKIGTPAYDFVLELREDSSSGTSLPTGQVLRSVSKDKHFLDSSGTTAVGSSFEINEELTPGHNYWIVCKANGATDSSNCFRWHRDALDTGTSATSADDITWALTTTPNRFNYAFQAYVGNDIVMISKDPNLVAASKHLHEDTLRKSEIIDEAVLRYLLSVENKNAHKKKEIFSCNVYAPDTLLQTGQKIRVRKQTSGYVIDSGTDGYGDFVLGGIEYIFESGDDQSTGTFYYSVELARFVPYN